MDWEAIDTVLQFLSYVALVIALVLFVPWLKAKTGIDLGPVIDALSK